MSENKHLAIASVPMQSWDRVYNENEAFCYGTVFPELNKPFFAVAEMEKVTDGIPSIQKQENMLLQIQKVSFVVDDVRLYLDTHPKDIQGITLLKTMIKKRKELLREYALQFYPLTLDCMADIYEKNPDSECYCWQEGPCPWEGVCV